MNIFEHMFSFLWGKCLGMELLGQFFRYILNIVRKCRTLFPIFYNFMLFLSCASAEHPGSWKECRLWNYVLSCPCVLTQSCLTFFNSMDCSMPCSSVHGFFRQEYWSELPFCPPRDLPNSEIELTSPATPH